MSPLGENTISPLQIEDARAAAHQASELQRAVEDEMRRAAGALADAERAYRGALAQKILELRAEGEPVTIVSDLARGEKRVRDLRHARDVAAGVLDAARQQAFRRGADRKDVGALIDWSMRRDLRVDTPPPGYDTPPREINP